MKWNWSLFEITLADPNDKLDRREVVQAFSLEFERIEYLLCSLQCRANRFATGLLSKRFPSFGIFLVGVVYC